MPVKKELLHPSDIITAVREKEFADLRHLREHLRGERKYPLVFKLNLPKSSDVHEGLRNKNFITGYTDFQLAWKKFPHQEMIRSCSFPGSRGCGIGSLLCAACTAGGNHRPRDRIFSQRQRVQ